MEKSAREKVENRFYEILGAVILEGYPELIGADITICLRRGDKYPFYMRSCTYEERNRQLIEISDDEISIIAYFAHELSHGIYDNSFSLKKWKIRKRLFERSKVYREFEENNADIDVILRGFGPDLLHTAESNGQKKYGLRKKEIKSILNKISKIES